MMYLGPLRKVFVAAFFALAFPIVAAAVAPTVGFGLIALSAFVEQQVGVQAERNAAAPSLPLEGRPKPAEPASGGGTS